MNDHTELCGLHSDVGDVGVVKTQPLQYILNPIVVHSASWIQPRYIGRGGGHLPYTRLLQWLKRGTCIQTTNITQLLPHMQPHPPMATVVAFAVTASPSPAELYGVTRILRPVQQYSMASSQTGIRPTDSLVGGQLRDIKVVPGQCEHQ